MSERRLEFSVSADAKKPPRRRQPTNEWMVEEPTRPDAIARGEEALPPLSRSGL